MLCREPHQTPRDVAVELAEWDKKRSHTAPEVSLDALHQRAGLGAGLGVGPDSSEDLLRQQKRAVAAEMAAYLRVHGTEGGEDRREGGEERREGGEEKREGGISSAKGLVNGTEGKKRTNCKFTTKLMRKRREKESLIRSVDFDRVGHSDYMDTSSDSDHDDCFTNQVGGAKGSEFRSLLLFIPLRLGQEKFNMEYKEAVKV